LDKAAKAFTEKTSLLRELLISNLPKPVTVNVPKESFVPHIISLSLTLPKSQPILNFLSAKGIYISSGSACSSHKNTVSHVLTAFGIPKEIADGTIRVSLDSQNTEQEVLTFCDALKEGIEKLGK
jgi:cysteine desulfurase